MCKLSNYSAASQQRQRRPQQPQPVTGATKDSILRTFFLEIRINVWRVSLMWYVTGSGSKLKLSTRRVDKPQPSRFTHTTACHLRCSRAK